MFNNTRIKKYEYISCMSIFVFDILTIWICYTLYPVQDLNILLDAMLIVLHVIVLTIAFFALTYYSTNFIAAIFIYLLNICLQLIPNLPLTQLMLDIGTNYKESYISISVVCFLITTIYFIVLQHRNYLLYYKKQFHTYTLTMLRIINIIFLNIVCLVIISYNIFEPSISFYVIIGLISVPVLILIIFNLISLMFNIKHEVSDLDGKIGIYIVNLNIKGYFDGFDLSTSILTNKDYFNTVMGLSQIIKEVGYEVFIKNKEEILEKGYDVILVFDMSVYSCDGLSKKYIDAMLQHYRDIMSKYNSFIHIEVRDNHLVKLNSVQKQIMSFSSQATIGEKKEIRRAFVAQLRKMVRDKNEMKTISKLCDLFIKYINDKNGIIADHLSFYLESIKIQKEPITAYYLSIRFIDFIIHYLGLCIFIANDDLSNKTYIDNFSSGRWLNEYIIRKDVGYSIFDNEIDEVSMEWYKKLKSLTNSSKSKKNSTWKSYLMLMVELRNRTIGHGILVYDICKDIMPSILSLIIIMYDVCIKATIDSESIEKNDYIIYKDNMIYLLTSNLNGELEYLCYKNGDIFCPTRKKVVINSACKKVECE